MGWTVDKGGRMQLESRIRRQREFLNFLLEKFAPKCYWCDVAIDIKSFDLPPGHDPDPLTIHHVDETGNTESPNNHIDNRVIIHKACHQEMHKLSTKLGLPPMLIREAKFQVKTQ